MFALCLIRLRTNLSLCFSSRTITLVMDAEVRFVLPFGPGVHKIRQRSSF